MNKFATAFAELIGNEGAFKKQANDRMDWTGGKVGVGNLVGTKYGISAGTYPKLDIPNLTLAEAQALYKQDFWDRFKGDDLPYELGYQIFDSEVNHGKTMGVRFLQEAIGTKVDGVLGPITLATVLKLDEDKVIMRFLAVRMVYFTNCSTWDSNGRGWARRVANNLKLATEPN